MHRTRGKSLEEMDIVLHSHSGERDVRRMEKERIGLGVSASPPVDVARGTA